MSSRITSAIDSETGGPRLVSFANATSSTPAWGEFSTAPRFLHNEEEGSKFDSRTSTMVVEGSESDGKASTAVVERSFRRILGLQSGGFRSGLDVRMNRVGGAYPSGGAGRLAAKFGSLVASPHG